MHNKIIGVLTKRKGLIYYMVLNYIDKAVVFAGPFFVLFLLNDKVLYNEIEYAYAVAPLLAVVLDANVRVYFLQAYREADNRSTLVDEVGRYFHLQLSVYIVLAIIAIALLSGYGARSSITFACAMRGLYILAQGFYQRYYRLLDAPSRGFIFSLSGGVATIVVVAAFGVLDISMRTWQFFSAQSAVVMLACMSDMRSITRVEWIKFQSYIWRAFIYGWPVFINVLAMTLLNNVGKIYAFSALPAEDMFRLSLIQRIAMLVQLTHAGMIGFSEKKLFLEDSSSSMNKIFIAYTIVIATAAGGVLVVLWALPHISTVDPGPIDMIAVITLINIILWCVVSFGEMLLLKYHAQKFIPIFSIAGFLVSASILYSGRVIDLHGVVLATLAGVSANFICTFMTIYARRRANIA